MAKPPQFSEKAISPIVRHNSDRGPRKRTCSPILAQNDPLDDTHKTRRVNPQRLAARLDARLVEEMETLIVPGAKMPTFAIRKDFQERYSVDRRHIYDYFHSRGLRVAREDKYTNLTKGRLSKLPPAKDIPLIGCMSTDNTSKIQMSTTGLEISEVPLARTAKRLAAAKIFEHETRRRPEESPTYSPVLTLSSKKRPRLSPDIYATSGSPCPQFTMHEETSDSISLGSDSHASTPNLSPEQFLDLGCTMTDFSIDLPFDACQSDPLMAVDEHRPLTESERTELYNLVNSNINPPRGIEECSGTYCAYMGERSRLYFDRLFVKPAYGPVIYNTGDDSSLFGKRGTEDDVDFRQWLSGPIIQEDYEAENERDSNGQPSLLPMIHKETVEEKWYNSHFELEQHHGLDSCSELPLLDDLFGEGLKTHLTQSDTAISRHDINHDGSSSKHAPLASPEPVDEEPRVLLPLLYVTPYTILKQYSSRLKRHLYPVSSNTAHSNGTCLDTRDSTSLGFYRASNITTAYSSSSDCRTRLALLDSKPSHLRTASAGGGI